MTDYLFKANALSAYYNPAEQILNISNFGWKKKESIVLVGASGTGKSTLLKLILNWQVKSEGSLQRSDALLDTGSVAYVSQNSEFIPWKTVEENVLWAIRGSNHSLPKLKQQVIVNEVLQMVGLEKVHKKFPDQLSGGMARRLMFAQALAIKPKVFLLDEAFGALDVVTKGHLLSVLCKYITMNDSSMIAVTHDLNEAAILAHKITIVTKSGDLVDFDYAPSSFGMPLNTSDVAHAALNIYNFVKPYYEENYSN